MKRKLRLELSFGLFLAVLVAAVLLTFVFFRRTANAPTTNDVNTNKAAINSQIGTISSFAEIRTATFVSSSPLHNAVLASSPNTVSVTVSETLGPDSSLAVQNADGQALQLGSATFSDDRRTMTTLLRSGVSGPLRVSYRICKLSGTCESGSFGFTIRPITL